MERRYDIILSRGSGSPAASPLTVWGRVKLILSAAVLAVFVIGVLVAAVIVGSVLAAVLIIVAAAALVVAIIRGRLRRRRFHGRA